MNFYKTLRDVGLSSIVALATLTSCDDSVESFVKDQDTSNNYPKKVHYYVKDGIEQTIFNVDNDSKFDYVMVKKDNKHKILFMPHAEDYVKQKFGASLDISDKNVFRPLNIDEVRKYKSAYLLYCPEDRNKK